MENGKEKSRLHQAQKEVEEVKDIILDNLDKVNERSGKLGELENRADQLLEKSKVFSKTAGKVKRQKWWENMKMKVLLGGLALLVIIIIIIIAVMVTNKKSDQSSQNLNQTTPKSTIVGQIGQPETG